MQKFSIKYLRPGMRVARPIYHSTGQLLLRRGTILTEPYIERLNRLFIPAVYVSMPREAERTSQSDVISDQLRIEALKNVSAVFTAYKQSNSLDEVQIANTTTSILDAVLKNQDNLIQVSDIRTYDDYTFSHSVNVCIMASMMGALLCYNYDAMRDLALGALLHDIGKMHIPLEILNKKGRLDEAEFNTMKQHSMLGYTTLDLAGNYNLQIKQIALQHHEKYDGSGYPRGITGDKISEFSRIVTIADIYDALTAERAYKKAFPPHQAYQIMVNDYRKFDIELMDLFFKHVAIYPVGTTVQLADGRYGIVVDIQNAEVVNPIIQLIADANRIPISETEIINLKDSRHDVDFHVLAEDEVLDLMDVLNDHDRLMS